VRCHNGWKRSPTVRVNVLRDTGRFEDADSFVEEVRCDDPPLASSRRVPSLEYELTERPVQVVELQPGGQKQGDRDDACEKNESEVCGQHCPRES
jgi:hypothetical protein